MARKLTASEKRAMARSVASRATCASRKNHLGHIYNSDISGHWGDELTLTMKGGRVEFVVRSWSRIGGIDSLHGAGKPEVTARFVERADPRTLVRAIKTTLRDREHLWLKGAKPSTFQWTVPWTSKGPKGVTIKSATAALDGQAMSRAQWESKYVKPPAPKPAGGPFSFGPATQMADIIAQFGAAGHPLEKHPRAQPFQWGLNAVLLKRGRAWKEALKLMEASADSMRKAQSQDGWDVYTFDFGGKEISLGKIYYGYPLNSMRWSLWTK